MSTRVLVVSVLITLSTFIARADDAVQIPLAFSGGHETDGRDHGRPVVLIAAALNVTPEVFRDAFSHVHPAGPGQHPQEGQVRENKRQLMKRLGPHGVTDARLNQVSNHFRYRREAGTMWPHRDAQGYATEKDGKILSITIVDPGVGYSSIPQVTIPGQIDVHFAATIHFDTDLAKDGCIATVTQVPYTGQ